MDAATEQPAQPRRRWFRFSLRTLLIVVTVLSVTLGWVGWRLQQVRREQATIAWVEEMDGRVSFHKVSDKSSWWEKSTNKWFGERVRGVTLSPVRKNDLSPLTKFKKLKELVLLSRKPVDISPLADLKNLETLSLYLYGMEVRDLSHLVELKKLRELNLVATKVSVEQVRKALPNCRNIRSLDGVK
jgi:hypothetical protein